MLQNLARRARPRPGRPAVPHQAGGRLSRDAVERLVAKHAATAAAACPSIKEKNVTPHTLRHTAAMSLLQGGVDTSVIALWLGHEDAETTQVYLHADMTIKEQALARVQPPDTSPGRYRAARHPAGVPRQPLTTARAHRVMPTREQPILR